MSSLMGSSSQDMDLEAAEVPPPIGAGIYEIFLKDLRAKYPSLPSCKKLEKEYKEKCLALDRSQDTALKVFHAVGKTIPSACNQDLMLIPAPSGNCDEVYRQQSSGLEARSHVLSKIGEASNLSDEVNEVYAQLKARQMIDYLKKTYKLNDNVDNEEDAEDEDNEFRDDNDDFPHEDDDDDKVYNTDQLKNERTWIEAVRSVPKVVRGLRFLSLCYPSVKDIGRDELEIKIRTEEAVLRKMRSLLKDRRELAQKTIQEVPTPVVGTSSSEPILVKTTVVGQQRFALKTYDMLAEDLGFMLRLDEAIEKLNNYLKLRATIDFIEKIVCEDNDEDEDEDKSRNMPLLPADNNGHQAGIKETTSIGSDDEQKMNPIKKRRTALNGAD